MIVTLWLIELLLELSGSIASRWRGIFLLYYLLAARAAVDLVTILIRFSFGLHEAYAWAWLAGQVVQVGVLCILVCQLAGKLLKDYRPLSPYARLLGLIVAAFTFAAWMKGDTMLHRWLDAQIAAGMSLLGSLLIAWGFRKDRLVAPWSGIALGVVVHVAGMVVWAFLWEFAGQKFYAAPQIAALVLWNWAVWRLKKETQAIQVERAPKFEPQGVYHEFHQRRVM